MRPSCACKVNTGKKLSVMINSEKIDDVDSFERVIESVPPGKAVALRVMRDGVTRFIAYTPAAEE